MEGHLDNSPHFSKHIPRGELVELLSKALLYIEVEAHWKADGMTSNCKSAFTLLETHACAVDPPADSAAAQPPPTSAALEKKPGTQKTNGVALADSAAKRKASTPAKDDARSEKRAKRGPDEMDVDSAASTSEREAFHRSLRVY